jgi:uncharacterized protein (DUF1778 family)
MGATVEQCVGCCVGKRRGRHKVGQPRIQRQVRWTDAEWDQVRRAAQREGQSVSEFVRSVVLGRCREA